MEDVAGLPDKTLAGLDCLEVLGRGITTPALAVLGEDNEPGLVRFQTVDVDSQRLDRQVTTAVIHGDADRGGKLLRDPGFL